MQTIKRLPKSVHSSLRSTIILSDLPRVVEELIYNSIDANASKVLLSHSKMQNNLNVISSIDIAFTYKKGKIIYM